MQFQSDFYRCVSVWTLWMLKSDVKCLLCHNATHNNNVKVHQRVSEESRKLLTERYGGQHRGQLRLDSTIVWRARWWISSSHASASESRVTSYQLLTSTPLPQQPMQMGWWCLDTKIQSDHLQITVWTVCLKDLIWETNLICLQSGQSLTQRGRWAWKWQLHWSETTVGLQCVPLPPGVR